MNQQIELFSNKALKDMIIPLFLEQLLVMLVGLLRLMFGNVESDVMQACITYSNFPQGFCHVTSNKYGISCN